MAKAHSFPLNWAHCQVTLKMTNSMVKANGSTQAKQVAVLTKANSKIAGSMAKASTSGKTVCGMMVTGKMIRRMAREPNTMSGVNFILAAGKMVISMVKVIQK